MLLSPLTTFRVGGPAEICAPRTVEELALTLEWCAETQTPWRALGRGSNLLVSDDGVDGLVIQTRSLDRLEFGEDGLVSAGAGLRTSVLLGRTRDRGLGGLSCLVGYPATVGGAARMNAGGKWGSTSAVIESVRVVGAGGLVRTLTAEQCAFGYRTSSLGASVVAEVTFRLPPVDPREYRAQIDAIHREKAASQPLSRHSAGCIFKNPRGASAGFLVQEAGLKGLRAGRAVVSKMHGNFIVNEGGATAADVHELIDRVRERVHAAFGVNLELEVEVWGGTPVPAHH